MKNYYYDKLKKWKSRGRGFPLVLIGPRFVGKTTLMKEFGKNEFNEVVYINFEEMEEINELFDGSMSLDELLKKAAGVLGLFEINTEKTLFIIDEIQACPYVMHLAKFVYEKIPPLYIMFASSNPGDALDIDISDYINKIEFLKIRPINFETFLSITEHNLYKKYITINSENNLDKILHNQLLNELYNYLIVGGLPEIVYGWKQTKNFDKVLELQNNLILKQKNSFIKSCKKYNVEKIFEIFDCVPKQLENQTKKFKFVKLNQNARLREYNVPIQWLIKASCISKLNQVSDNKANLCNFINEKNYRIYLTDVGLLKYLLNIKNDQIFQNKDFKYKKSLMENFVFQQIKSIFEGETFFYFSFNRFDLDFLLEYENEIIPIDIKFSNIRTKTSLGNYIRKWKPKLAIVYSFGFLKYKDGIINIPFYLINKTPEIIDYFLKQLNDN